MPADRKFLRLVASLVAIVMLAAACGDDDGGGASPFGPGADDTDSPDSGSGDLDPDDSDSDPAPDPTPDPTPDPVPDGDVDCAALGDALDAAGDIVATDPLSSGGADDLQQGFAESRAQIEALKSQVPELSGDVDAVLAGMDVLGDLFASIDWDPSTLAADPTRIAEFAGILSDPAFIGMQQAFSNVGLYIASACS